MAVCPMLDVIAVPDRARVIVRAVGEVDLATAPALAATIDELLGVGWAEMQVDLRDVWFMDSAGVHLLADVVARARREDVALSILQSASVAHVLSLTGVAESIDDAALRVRA